jgi:hypothetical protein
MSSEQHFPLTPSQIEAERMFTITTRNMYLYGGGGTGKSTVMMRLQDIERRNGRCYAVVASTGSAAHNVGGVTIAKMFLYPPGVKTARGWVQTLEQMERAVTATAPGRPDFYLPGATNDDRELFYSLHTLFIDEISMVDAGVLAMINTRLQLQRASALPFGGVRVVAVGDFAQLRPFSKSGPGLYAFQPWRLQCDPTDVRTPWADAQFVSVELREQMRANGDMRHQMIAAHMRSNVRFEDWPKDAKDLLLSRTYTMTPPAAEDITHCYWSNAANEERNQKKNNALSGAIVIEAKANTSVTYSTRLDESQKTAWGVKLCMSESELKSVWASIEADNRLIPWKTSLPIKVGSKLMITKNVDQTNGVFNGAVGVFMGVGKRGLQGESRTLCMKLDSDGKTAYIEPVTDSLSFGRRSTSDDWESLDGIDDSVVNQFSVICHFTWTYHPVIFGWSITYHKLQGMTLPGGIVLAVSQHMDANMVYTAFTRATAIDKVYVVQDRSKIKNIVDKEKLLTGAIKCDANAVEFMAALRAASGRDGDDEGTTKLLEELKERARAAAQPGRSLLGGDEAGQQPEELRPRLCQMCCARYATVANLPCAHVLACVVCDAEMIRLKMGTCPACRTNIAQRVRLYF